MGVANFFLHCYVEVLCFLRTAAVWKRPGVQPVTPPCGMLNAPDFEARQCSPLAGFRIHT